MDFHERHVVVTGGTGALGTAVVGRLLASGAFCHVPNLAAGELQLFPYGAERCVQVTAGVDLGVESQVTAYFASLPPLWASIHLAGGFSQMPIADTSLAAFAEQFDRNVATCFLCCREAIRAMRAGDGGGRIVNVAARPALEPRQGAGMVSYTVAKAAVAALTQALAEEVAEEGIWINAVAPSILDTPTNRDAMPEADPTSWPKVEDVAETIVHLASPSNGVVRGGVVPVYGRC